MLRTLPVLLLTACAAEDTSAGGGAVEATGCVPAGASAGDHALEDWSLQDKNPSSPTAGLDRSPRCTLDQIGLYFMLDAA